MEGLALILFYITLIGIIATIGLIIYSAIKKKIKYRPKQISIVLVFFIVAFIGSTIFYSVVQSPESKAKFEANQQAKTEEEMLKQEEQQAKKEVETKADAEATKGAQVEVKAEPKEEKNIEDNRFTLNAEANTSAAVDELILRGKKDSKNATKDNIKEAIKFIADNYNKYWTDNETMKKTMYYGALLEYSNEDKNIKELGLDSVQVVKYIYRKVEKVEDSSTQSNLEQIKKSLDKIPSSLK